MRKTFCNKCGRETKESTTFTIDEKGYYLKGDLCRKCAKEIIESMKLPLEKVEYERY